MTDRLHRWIAARLTPGGEAGLHLTVGVLLMLGTGWAFASIADGVVRGEAIVQFDHQVTRWVQAWHQDWLTGFMLFITHWHDLAGVLAMTAVVALWFWYRQAHYWLATLLLVVPGGIVLNVLLKYTFERPRPRLDEPLLTLLTYSFPSGHAAAATLFYGLLAAYLVRTERSRAVWVLAALAASTMVLLVAASRVYLGVHYFSDVLAAIAEGVLWLSVCITTVSTLRRRQQRLSPVLAA